jgi:hypothetical protein
MNRRTLLKLVSTSTLLVATGCRRSKPTSNYGPGKRVMLDAHNCYPYAGQYADRLETALRCGFPIAIEQDLVWHKDRRTQLAKQVVAHTTDTTGDEPSLDQYFFSQVTPETDRVQMAGNVARWPVMILNLDLKTNEPAHHQALWDLFDRYTSSLTTATKTGDPANPGKLDWKPMFVLTGDSDEQETFFYRRVPVDATLRLFGAVKPLAEFPAPPEQVIGAGGSEYRRWVNLPWKMIEGTPQPKSGEWTTQKAERLRAFVDYAHAKNLWIRFYTLNGHTPEESKGWSPEDNFGSLEAVQLRWKAAIEAGVDFIATDQYEELARLIRASGQHG